MIFRTPNHKNYSTNPISAMAKIATVTASSSQVVCCVLLALLHSLHSLSTALVFTPRSSISRAKVSTSTSTALGSADGNINIDSDDMSGDLKRILVTGANTGIGLALTKQLVSDYNCHVYLGSRNAERGASAVEEVKKCTGKDSVELLTIVSVCVCVFPDV